MEGGLFTLGQHRNSLGGKVCDLKESSEMGVSVMKYTLIKARKF
jgi:hypothetical protein